MKEIFVLIFICLSNLLWAQPGDRMSRLEGEVIFQVQKAYDRIDVTVTKYDLRFVEYPYCFSLIKTEIIGSSKTFRSYSNGTPRNKKSSIDIGESGDWGCGILYRIVKHSSSIIDTMEINMVLPEGAKLNVGSIPFMKGVFYLSANMYIYPNSKNLLASERSKYIRVNTRCEKNHIPCNPYSRSPP